MEFSDERKNRGEFARLTPNNTVFNSLYSALSTTVFTETGITGDAVIVKSDRPVVLRINGNAEVRDIYDYLIPGCVEMLGVRAQEANTTAPDCRVLIYGVDPKKVLQRWEKELDKYPNSTQRFLVTNSALTAISGSIDASGYAQENVYISSIFLRDSNSGAAITEGEILDSSTPWRTIWSGLQAPAQNFLYNGPEYIKAPPVFNWRFRKASLSGGASGSINFKYR